MDQIKPLHPPAPARPIVRDKKRKPPLPAPKKREHDPRPPADDGEPTIDEYAL